MAITDMHMSGDPFTEEMGKVEEFLNATFPGQAYCFFLMTPSEQGGVDVLSYVNADNLESLGNMLMQFGADVVRNADMDPRRTQ